jgi:hypothetical protein
MCATVDWLLPCLQVSAQASKATKLLVVSGQHMIIIEMYHLVHQSQCKQQQQPLAAAITGEYQWCQLACNPAAEGWQSHAPCLKAAYVAASTL